MDKAIKAFYVLCIVFMGLVIVCTVNEYTANATPNTDKYSMSKYESYVTGKYSYDERSNTGTYVPVYPYSGIYVPVRRWHTVFNLKVFNGLEEDYEFRVNKDVYYNTQIGDKCVVRVWTNKETGNVARVDLMDQGGNAAGTIGSLR